MVVRPGASKEDVLVGKNVSTAHPPTTPTATAAQLASNNLGFKRSMALSPGICNMSPFCTFWRRWLFPGLQPAKYLRAEVSDRDGNVGVPVSNIRKIKRSDGSARS
jgi:hypothetical protein